MSIEVERPSTAIGLRDHLLGAVLALSYVALLVATAGDLAMSRDESFYAVAADRYGGWFEQLAADPEQALQRRSIDRAWEYNREHPALLKSLFAFGHLLQKRHDLFASDSLAYRFPAMLCAGLLLWLIYIFGARALGRAQGAFAALGFALLPRVFYHAHLSCFDVPIVLMTTWVIYAYWRSLSAPRRGIWVLWTGVAFGFALATKHNSWILPGLLLIHFVWLRASRRVAPAEGVARAPWWLLSMATIGPVIFIGSWPWLWHDTLERFAWYASFHLHHDYYNMAYFGVNYFRPPFPISFPWVMTAITWPVTLLALVVAGLVVMAPALWPAWLRWPNSWSTRARQAVQARGGPDPRETAVLWLGAMLAPLVLISLPSTPIFGGTKHWFPAYPFMMLFAGAGLARVMAVLRAVGPGLGELLGRRLGFLFGRLANERPRLLMSLTAALLLAPAAVETAHSHPFGLSHYGFLTGGVPGAADAGMNRQFWGFTTGSVVPFLRERLPRGGRVWICDTTFGALRMLQRDGVLPPNIRPVADIAQADLALVHHEHHYAEVDHQIWTVFGTVQPAHVLTYDGVPIVSVYEHPRRRQAKRPKR